MLLSALICLPRHHLRRERWPLIQILGSNRVADEQYLTPAQVADELQVTVTTVRRWITSGALRASKAGPRKWMIRRSDLADFLSSDSRGLQAEASEDPSFKSYLVAPGDR
jgi:excisionase family DNA binding protein